MAYSSLPTLVPGDPVRASYVDLLDTNLDDHETRIVALEGGGGTGDVDGPASATDNALARFDATTGKLIQNSGITVADGAAGTLAGSNSGDLTLAGTPDYVTLSGQVLTRGLVDLATDVTGDLPFANLTPATGASKLLGRGSAAGGGDYQEVVLGANLSFSGTTLNASGGAGGGDVDGPASSVDAEIALFDSTSGKLLKRATGTGPVKVTSGVYSVAAINLSGAEVTGDLQFANLAPLSASKLAGRGSAGGTGDLQEITLGTNLAMSGTTLNAALSAATRTIGITVDGGGSALTTGVKGDIYVPFACTIQSVTMLADQSGSVVIDIWKDTYANYPPVVGDSITASAKPTISAATKSQDATLTGWTTAIAAGSTLRFNVDSASTLTRVTLVLEVV